jgi:syntaxin-binding protein 1
MTVLSTGQPAIKRIVSVEKEFNFKTLLKNRILHEMIGSVKSSSAGKSNASDPEAQRIASTGGRGFVLVVDSHTLRVLSSSVRRYDLTELGVTFIEQIEKPRQPFPDMDVIYFLSPTELSVSKLISDHPNNEGCLYNYSFIFFSSSIPERLFNTLLGNKTLIGRCSGLTELNNDCVIFDDRTFHCDSPLAVREIKFELDKNFQNHLNCLKSVFASLREKPVIRFQSSSNLTQKLALNLRREVDHLAKSSELRSVGTTCVILDRSVDTSGLMLHDFFYQAMLLDVLDGVEPGVQWSLGVDYGNASDTAEQATSVHPSYEYKTTTGKGVEEVRKILLTDENDEFYNKFKFNHFKEVSDSIRSEMLKLREANEGRELGEMVRILPEFQDKISKISSNLEICKQLNEIIQKLNLMEVANIEQELATAIDDDGKEINCTKTYNSLVQLLTSGRVGPEERLRLVATYLSQVDGIAESTARELVRNIAKLDEQYEQAVIRYLDLGIHGVRAGGEEKNSGRSSFISIKTNNHSIKLNKNKIKKNKLRNKNFKFVNSRFSSEISNILELALNNSLNIEEYPTLSGTGSSNYSGTPGEPAAGGTRSTAAMWGAGNSQKSEKQKIVVFVVGGVTLAEIREVHELSQHFGVEILLGGSTILTPKRLIEALLAPP